MIYCLAAVDKTQGIGFENQMPWPRLKGDMQWFRETTIGNIIVMGSNTWKSLGNPLPDRLNIVISSKLFVDATHTYLDPAYAIKDLSERYSNRKIFIIGGQQVYDSVKELIDVFYITEIDNKYKCDKFFDYGFVKENFTNVKEISSFEKTKTTPAYTIREYTR